jgi:hypothetical protein
VHRKKKYPHNRWAPRTWRGGALECLTIPQEVKRLKRSEVFKRTYKQLRADQLRRA